jgi:serine/threonine protein phosphatase PrpC
MTREETLLLGEDHATYGELVVRTQWFGRTACGLSPGATSSKPDRHSAKNEDALLITDESDVTMIAVADGHYGSAASHTLLQRLASLAHPLPRNPIQLLEMIRESADPAANGRLVAESTLAVAVWDRRERNGFGASFGDSAVMVLGPDGPPVTANMKNHRYVNPLDPGTLDPRRAFEFSFLANPGDLLIVFSDGIDECNYRRPETSVRPRHLKELWRESQPSPEQFVSEAIRLALAGVDGHPGGEDNIALTATLV